MSFNTADLLQHISLDCVVFGFHDNQLKVLLLHTKFSDEWALPGGFVKREETLEDAAGRILFERTGVKNVFQRQFKVFSNPERSVTNPAVKDLIALDDNHVAEWFDQRFITVGFYALVDFTQAIPKPDFLSDKCEWKPMEDVGHLMMDHNEILDDALSALRLQLSYQPVGYNLLPEKFTMPELQKLYETILGRQLDRRNFQRKMLGYNILEKLDERKSGGAYKSPYLYKFNIENYQAALKEGLKAAW